MCLLGVTGKVTSLVARKDQQLAARIEEAMRKNESLESLTVDNVRRDIARARITEQQGKSAKLIKASNQKSNNKSATDKPPSARTKATSSVMKSGKPSTSARTKASTSVRTKATSSVKKYGTASTPAKSVKAGKVAKGVKSSSASYSRKTSPGVKKQVGKLRVVAFRGRSSSSNKKESLRPS